MLMRAERSLLLVVDVQDKLVPAIHEVGPVLAHTEVLLKAAAGLAVPVVVSEQYPRGLGATVPQVRALLPEGTPVLEKLHFSCLGESALGSAVMGAGRDQIVVCGIEAHVCVLQTVLHLRERGRMVFVVADATSSRSPANHRLALDRMAAAGAQVVSTEMVVFEWLHQAGTPIFKTLSALVR